MNKQDEPIIGRREGDTLEVTVATIRATGKAVGLSESQIAAALEAVMTAEEE